MSLTMHWWMNLLECLKIRTKDPRGGMLENVWTQGLWLAPEGRN